MNAELIETRGLARICVAQIEAYRSVRPINDAQRAAANRMEKAILGCLRTACDELTVSDFLDADEIKRELGRLEYQIAERRAALAA
jgi:hypothetical protein